MSSEFKCTCGNPRLSGVVHRLNAPCYHEDKPPTPLASTAMEAADEINDLNLQWLGDNATLTPSATAAIIQKHFQPLLAKVEGERDAALLELRAARNGITAWIGDIQSFNVALGLIPAAHRTETLEAIAAKEAVLAVAFEALDNACHYFETRKPGEQARHIHAKMKAVMMEIKYPSESALASRADKGGATAAGTPDELKAAVDALAQACGFPKSDNYVQMLETIGKRERRLTEANNTLRKEVAAFEKLFGLDTPWPAVALYKALVIAESKFREQGRDFDGWEAIQSAAAVAQQRVSDFLKE